jgi:hypothetical protein
MFAAAVLHHSVIQLLLNNYFIELVDILQSDPQTPILMARAAAATTPAGNGSAAATGAARGGNSSAAAGPTVSAGGNGSAAPAGAARGGISSAAAGPTVSAGGNGSAAPAGAGAAGDGCPAGCDSCSSPLTKTQGGCSDVVLALGPHQSGAGPEGRLLLGHNEDWSVDNKNATFFLIHKEVRRSNGLW